MHLGTQVGIEEELVAVVLLHGSVVAHESRLVVDDEESSLPYEYEIGLAFEDPIVGGEAFLNEWFTRPLCIVDEFKEGGHSSAEPREGTPGVGGLRWVISLCGHRLTSELPSSLEGLAPIPK
jgi:hypothetical protein